MKILVISLAGIGDTLLATPLIHELKEQYPSGRIDAFVLWAGSRDVLEGNPWLHTVFQKNLLRDGLPASLSYLHRLRRERYDLTLNTHPQSRIHYRVIAWLIHGRERLSHQYDNRSLLDGWLMTRLLPQDYTAHGIENNLRLLSLLDRPLIRADHPMEIYLSAEERAWADAYVREHGLEGRPLLGLHVGSGGTKNLALKRWPLEHYIELIRRWVQTHPRIAVLLFGGPEEQAAHAAIAAATAGAPVFAPPTRNLRQAAALLSRCASFLSVDTALMHLAAAMKVPNQIVIEAPTLNATNVPWHNPYRVVRNPAVAGRNLDYYRYDGQPIKGTRAELTRIMAAVTVDDVYRVLADVFA